MKNKVAMGLSKPKVKVTKTVSVKPLREQQKASISTLVKSMISRSSETKYVQAKVEQDIPHNSPIGSGDIVRVIPGVVQGIADWNRVGDNIKPISLRVRGLVSANRNAVTSNQVLLVRVIVAQYKSARSNPLLSASTSIIASSLLKPNYEGVGTTQSFNGDQSDLTAPINKDILTVYYDKVHRIAPVAPEQSVEENPSSYFRWFADIPTPASFDYDSSTGASPTNFCPFMCMGYAYADGQGPDNVAVKIISTTTSELRFKDM